MKKRTVLQWSISLLIVASLFYLADWSRILEAISKADSWLYASAVVVFLSSYIFHTVRWRKMAGKIGYQLSFSDSFKIISESYGFNQLFPGNSGDLARSKIFERQTEIDNHGEILGITLLERAIDAAAVVTIISVGVVIVGSELLGNLYWFLIPFIAGLITFAFVVSQRNFLEKISRFLPKRFEDEYRRFIDSYDKHSREDLFSYYVLGLLGWSMEVIAFFLLILSLGFDVTIWEGAVVTSSMSLISALPLSPGGIGFGDATATGLLVVIGLGYSSALTLTLAQRSLGIVLTALLGASVYWLENLYSSSSSSSLSSS